MDATNAKRDVLFSIKPFYVSKILAGEKTVELRRHANVLRRREIDTVIKRIQADVVRYRLSYQQIFGPLRSLMTEEEQTPEGPRLVRRRAAALPKYQNDHGQTWTGRGKRPRWFKEALQSGKTPEDLLIKY